MKRVSWGTRLGFYLAAIGSAFGLGNLWRFPYIVTENGGGAFVLLYIFLAFVVGMPLLIGELILGKSTRKGAVAALAGERVGSIVANKPKPLWRWVGLFTVLVTLIVLSYYAVISGWVLHYVVRMSVGSLRPGGYDPIRIMNILRENGWLQLALTSVHLLLTIVVVAKGIEHGVEKWVGYLMPAFIALLIVLLVQALSLPTTANALRFLFYPDFSKLTSASLIQALGHVCFTLSIGFGSMVTFGSYLTDKHLIPTAGFRVAFLDTMISLVAGLLIFPIVLASPGHVSGPEVLFLTMPVLFQQMDGGTVFGVAFFLCLYLAALNASIGLLEAVVSNVMDRFQVKRSTATWAAGAIAFTVSIFPALGSSVFRQVSFHGRTVLESVDDVLINWMLPLAALGLALYVFHKLPNEKKMREFTIDTASAKLYGNWLFVMQWLAPGIVVVAILLHLSAFIR